MVAHRLSELHLDREYAVVGALDDQVDLVLAGMGSQMTHACLEGLRVHAH